MYRPNVLNVWVYILCHVNWQPADVVYEGKRITLQPGQGLFKIREIARIFGVSSTSIHRIIEGFKSESQIETQTSPRNTIITVLNWNKYQVGETQIETQVEHKRNTSGTQVEHLPINKRIKEIKNKEKVKKEKSDFELFWNEYPRKENKQVAKKSFEKVIKSGVTLDTLLEAVRKHKLSEQWTKDNGQFIPHPSTWLNQGRWEDELNYGGSNGASNNQNMAGKPTGIESRAAAFEAAIRAAQERRKAGTVGKVQTGGNISSQDIRTAAEQGELPL